MATLGKKPVCQPVRRVGQIRADISAAEKHVWTKFRTMRLASGLPGIYFPHPRC
jgi:hypothetical protein